MMTEKSASAIASPNIAFIKYWGNRDHELRIPSNGSISMNLDGLFSRTKVTFEPALHCDELNFNDVKQAGNALKRVSLLLDRVRQIAGIEIYATVESCNSFPTGAGLASSASAFAALTMAACCALGLDLDERELSRLARTASGSACRSIPGGYVEWQAGEDDESSYAFSIAPPEHWDLVDCIAIVSRVHKTVGSYEGHSLADSSPLQTARIAGAPERLDICRRAIIERDFDSLADVVELDSNLMHAVIMTSVPRLFYWQSETLTVMRAVQDWRKSGLPVCYTIDAGPNVHVICPADWASQISSHLGELPGVKLVITAHPGHPAKRLFNEEIVPVSES